MDTSLTLENAHSNISAYEVEQNLRRKALHDAVESNLLAAGFGEAAALRSAFERQASTTIGEDTTPRPRKQRSKKGDSGSEVVRLRRTTRMRRPPTAEVSVTATKTSVGPKSGEGFCIWLGKGTKKTLKTDMKKNKGDLKRKQMGTPDRNMDVDHEVCDIESPSTHQTRKQRSFASEEGTPGVFEDDVQDLQLIQHERNVEGAPRPPPAGYRNPQHERQSKKDWGDDYILGHSQSSNLTYRDPFTRQRSPHVYTSGRDYDNLVGGYGGQSGPYDGRPDYFNRRDPYYGSRGRDFDRRDREYDEQRRYEDGRYDRLPSLASDSYGRAEDPVGMNQYVQVMRRGISPPPSSSTIVENEVKGEFNSKRPLNLDRNGIPTSPMASLFHADIVKFVKDMDPTVGWEGQTRDAKERLRDCLFKDYNFYGESTRLCEKFLRKQVGGALTQYRFTLNQYIDRGCDKPGDVKEEHWKTLGDRRKSKEAQEKSMKMASIARGRGSKSITKKALKQSVLVKLAKHLGREPWVNIRS